MPQLASRQRSWVAAFPGVFSRWLSAVFPKGAHTCPHRDVQVGRSLHGHVLRAPGEDGVILAVASSCTLDSSRVQHPLLRADSRRGPMSLELAAVAFVRLREPGARPGTTRGARSAPRPYLAAR
jgi:hypothetical protein